MAQARSFSNQELAGVLQVPNVILSPDTECQTDDLFKTKLHRGDNLHSSLRIPKKVPSRRHLCRHHSDSESRKEGGDKPNAPRRARPRSRRVRRSVSAIETNKSRYQPRVRRSISERSGLIMAGKHLMPPRSRPHSNLSERYSSRCSSTKTLSSNVSMSEIVAVELGLKDIPGLTPKEARRRRVVCTVMLVSITILVLCVILVAVTLFLSPEVDEILRKGNEEIYRSMTAGASTSPPTLEGAAVVNNTTPSSSTSG